MKDDNEFGMQKYTFAVRTPFPKNLAGRCIGEDTPFPIPAATPIPAPLGCTLSEVVASPCTPLLSLQAASVQSPICNTGKQRLTQQQVLDDDDAEYASTYGELDLEAVCEAAAAASQKVVLKGLMAAGLYETPRQQSHAITPSRTNTPSRADTSCVNTPCRDTIETIMAAAAAPSQEAVAQQLRAAWFEVAASPYYPLFSKIPCSSSGGG